MLKDLDLFQLGRLTVIALASTVAISLLNLIVTISLFFIPLHDNVEPEKDKDGIIQRIHAPLIILLVCLSLVASSCVSTEIREVSLSCEQEVLARVDRVKATDIVSAAAMKGVIDDLRSCSKPKETYEGKAFGVGVITGGLLWLPVFL